MGEEIYIPELTGDARAAVDHDGGHLQIIAGAGSGKTETVSQRVARLIADGVEPARIVAFTFTEKAAKELKERIRARVLARAGEEMADRLGNMYVGTIHGFCFQLLSTHIGTYESYTVMDENKFTAFLMRYAYILDLKQFANGKLFQGLSAFQDNLDIVENELLPLDGLPEEFRAAVEKLYELLDQHRMLTFGLLIARAVEVMQDDATRARVAPTIEHLIVDEYQDVNPAQEELIRLLAEPAGRANLVVVGDDDQAIYQWRGSSVENITTFTQRYDGVTTYQLLKNRRSRPDIVSVANDFAKTIPARLDKEITPDREHFGPAIDFSTSNDFERDEARNIAETIHKLHDAGFAYRDMAVLVRGRVAYPAILDAFEALAVPVNPGDRKTLFEQPDAEFFGKVFAWFADNDWRLGRYNPQYEKVELDDLVFRSGQLYELNEAQREGVRKLLEKLKKFVGKDSRVVSMVGMVYALLDELEVDLWDKTDPLSAARLGTLAKFINFVADFEGAYMQSRVDPDSDGDQIGSSDQGEWYFKNLSSLMLNYALGEYRDFGGEDDVELDAVDLMTVHGAKGLEWPIVFLPSLTQKRFPSSRAGRSRSWIVPREMFSPQRYEGSDADERRLFYVAITRARDWLSLSTHSAVNTQAARQSEYLFEVMNSYTGMQDLPDKEKDSDVSTADLQITYSEVAEYLKCGLSYWLRSRIGFPPEIVAEIGYGNAVHHLMRAIAEESTRLGRVLDKADIDRIMATDFFLPYANKAAARQMRQRAHKVVETYIDKYPDELTRLWEAERPFELALDGAIVSGRADVVLDMHEGVVNNLALVDYKTSIGTQEFDLQLQVYAEAGIREGLTVRGAFVHDLGSDARMTIDISPEARATAVAQVTQAVADIRARKFGPNPSESKCKMCDVRALCQARAAEPKPVRVPKGPTFE